MITCVDRSALTCFVFENVMTYLTHICFKQIDLQPNHKTTDLHMKFTVLTEMNHSSKSNVLISILKPNRNAYQIELIIYT